MRICIAGGPKTGKTTLSKQMASGVAVYHTDDLLTFQSRLQKQHDWSEQSVKVARWFDRQGPWIVEGVTVPRALRKWLKTHTGKPCDRIIYLKRPKVPQSQGQKTMGDGCDQHFAEVLQTLRARGVEVEFR